LRAVVTVKTAVDVGARPVFNLKMMQVESLFIGERGMLVDDDSLLLSVPQPIDAMPELAAANRSNAVTSTGR
jgi:hypothetical protein